MEEVPLHRIYTVNKELELRWNSMKEYLETRYKEVNRHSTVILLSLLSNFLRKRES